MTVQTSEKLINECGDIDLKNLKLFGIFIGDANNIKNRSPYQINSKGDQNKSRPNTACWKGYTSVFKITKDKEIHLIGFEFPFTENALPDTANEKITGDFWLDLRPNFMGPFIYVPFKDGKLIIDKKQWVQNT